MLKIRSIGQNVCNSYRSDLYYASFFGSDYPTYNVHLAGHNMFIMGVPAPPYFHPPGRYWSRISIPSDLLLLPKYDKGVATNIIGNERNTQKYQTMSTSNFTQWKCTKSSEPI